VVVAQVATQLAEQMPTEMQEQPTQAVAVEHHRKQVNAVVTAVQDLSL
jgi:hypothetical protein